MSETSRDEGADDLVILDGGLGHLLKAQGVEQLCKGLRFDELFAAGCLANSRRPDIVQRAHEHFIHAGADVITTNSFACTRWSLGKIGRESDALSLAMASAEIARKAASNADHLVRIAGSLPPLKESYQIRGQQEFDAMLEEYSSLAAALAPHVDLLLCETMASTAEALAAATAATSCGAPLWVSFTLDDSTQGILRSGERLSYAVAELFNRRVSHIGCVLVNCCSPAAVGAAMPILASAVPDGCCKFGGYANGFKQTTSEWLLNVGASQISGASSNPPVEYDTEGIILPSAYAGHARQWVAEGASVVGGCCGIGPAHIAELVKMKGLNCSLVTM